MTHLLKRIWPEEEAQNLPEYALLLFLVSLTAVTAMGGLATRISHAYTSASIHVEAASPNSSLSGSSPGYETQFRTRRPSPFEDESSLSPR